MMPSNPSSLSSPRAPKLLVFFLGLFALVGFFDSSYLTVEHYRGNIPPCSLVSGCEKVLTSSYSVIAGVPLSLLGALFYFSFLVLVILYVDTGKMFPLVLLRYQVILGFLVSCILLFLQLFVLKAVCLYCLISVTSSTILFILGFPLSNFLVRNQSELSGG